MKNTAIKTTAFEAAIGLAMLTLLLFTVASALTSSPSGEALRGHILRDYAGMATALLAVVACLLTARRAGRSEERRAWHLLAASYGSIALGSLAAILVETSLRTLPPFPNVTDVLYLVFYPLAFIAVLHLARAARSNPDRAEMTVDTFIFTLGIAAIAWQVIVRPSTLGSSEFASAVSFAYIFGDLLLVFAVSTVFLAGRLTTARWPLYLLFAALAAAVVADLSFAYGTFRNAAHPSPYLDPLWTLGYALAGTAALRRRRELARPPAGGEALAPDPAVGRSARRPYERLRTVLPYATFPLTVAVIALVMAGRATATRPTAALGLFLGIILVTTVMVRQFLTLTANIRLQDELADAARELELRVEERTAELRARTDLAMRISLSPDLVDVVEIGLRGARDLLRAHVGLAWLSREEDLLWIHIDPLEPEVITRLEGLIKAHQDLAPQLAGGQPLVLDNGDFDGLGELLAERGRAGDQVVLVPLHARRSVLGAMILLFDADRTLEQRDFDLMRTLGAELGVACENSHQFELARYYAERDALTGLLNRRSLQEELETEWRRAARHGAPLSIAMIDLDDFKTLNDTLGHLYGDLALQTLAAQFRQTLRASDGAGRWGGDELMIILPETDTPSAIALCHRLQLSLVDATEIELRASIGVATYPRHAQTTLELVDIADRQLYESKRAGGDCVSAPGERGTCEPSAAEERNHG